MDGEVRDTDWVEWEDTLPGTETTETVFSGWELGETGQRVYTCKVDANNQLPELYKDDNQLSMTLNVVPHKSDVIVEDLYPKTDSGQIVRDGGSIPEDSVVHPYCLIKNIGNRNVKKRHPPQVRSGRR